MYIIQWNPLYWRLSGAAVLLSHFTWNGITSVRTSTKLHRLIGSNNRFIGPVNSEPRVDSSKMSKRADLSLAEKIATEHKTAVRKYDKNYGIEVHTCVYYINTP